MTTNDPFALYSKDRENGPQVKNEPHLAIDAVPCDFENADGKAVAKPARSGGSGMVVLFVACFLIILGRLIQLQLIQQDRYLFQAEGNRTHTETIKALRGIIYDEAGEPLVRNNPDFRLMLTARELPYRYSDNYEQTITDIRQVAHLGIGEFEKKLLFSFQSGQPVELRSHIPYEEALALMIQIQRMPAVHVETFYSREYLADESYAHLLGYMGKITQEEYEEIGDEYLLNDEIGKTGLELYYERELRGKDGKRNIEVDYRGREITEISNIETEPGSNIHLTVDPVLQQIAFDTAQSYTEEHGLPGATVVAIDPSNGAVRALVSYPTYDNNLFAGGISQDEYEPLATDERKPLFHRAISGTYPSGSTFKPIVAAAALDEGVVTPSTTVMSTGGIQIENFFFPDWKSGGHGETDVYKALAESVNTFFYLAGGGDNETNTGLGVKRITDYARRFGLGQLTQVDLPGEQSGFLPSKGWKEEQKDEPWYIGDTYHLAIGQGDILVTPIQVANYTAAIANGGTLYRPHLVSCLSSPDGNVFHTIEATALNEEAASPGAVATVQRGLREAVLTGSAKQMQQLPFSSAGKTGTAQFGQEEKTHSWFTAFAPYENPTLAITVLFEEGGEGSDLALPATVQILQQYAAAGGIH